MKPEMILRLAHCLSHEETVSGEVIARQLSVSRTAVWKHMESLRKLGVEIDADAGLGYRLQKPLELLNQDRIVGGLRAAARRSLQTLVIEPVVDSTNARLRAMPPANQHGTVMLAEYQQAGRGRHGRNWVSPFGSGICMSAGWLFPMSVAQLGCLPLLVAVSACEALRQAGLRGHGIKWPNDLVIDGKKLGGCLVEVQGDAGGPCAAVMGIGVNVFMPASVTAEIDQPWSDVAAHLPGVSRNGLASGILDRLLSNVLRYQDEGFEPFMDAWKAHDRLAGREVVLQTPAGKTGGTAAGITRRGGLVLQSSAGQTEYLAGEVSFHS